MPWLGRLLFMHMADSCGPVLRMSRPPLGVPVTTARSTMRRRKSSRPCSVRRCGIAGVRRQIIVGHVCRRDRHPHGATRGFARRRLIAPGRAQPSLSELTEDESAASPVNQLIHAEQQQRVHVLLQRLPEKQRDVVRLFHLQGQSYVQISEQLSMPIGSIGPTLRRAEAKLREWLEGD